MLLIACGRVATGPASSIMIVALGYSLGSGGQLSPSIERSHVPQAPDLSNEIYEQGRAIVSSPCQIKPQSHVQIDHRQDGNGCRGPPTCGSENPSYAQPGRHETQDGGLVQSLLNDARRLQTSAV